MMTFSCLLPLTLQNLMHQNQNDYRIRSEIDLITHLISVSSIFYLFHVISNVQMLFYSYGQSNVTIDVIDF